MLFPSSQKDALHFNVERALHDLIQGSPICWIDEVAQEHFLICAIDNMKVGTYHNIMHDLGGEDHTFLVLSAHRVNYLSKYHHSFAEQIKTNAHILPDIEFYAINADHISYEDVRSLAGVQNFAEYSQKLYAVHEAGKVAARFCFSQKANDYANSSKNLWLISKICQILPAFIIKSSRSFQNAQNMLSADITSNTTITPSSAIIASNSAIKTDAIISDVITLNGANEQNDKQNSQINTKSDIQSNILHNIHNFNKSNINHYITLSILDANALQQYEESLLINIENVCSGPIQIHNNTLHKAKGKVVTFRSGIREHYAIMIDPHPDHQANIKPIVRLHSSCMTGDLLRSIKCDCYPQLHLALDIIGQSSAGGVVIYLNQEGRGIGLSNKLRTYYLQEECDLDTVEANHALGLLDDARDFRVAAQILNTIGIGEFDLLTNNPKKADALKSLGLNIHSCIAHVVTETEELRKYYVAKAQKLNHNNFYTRKD